MLGTCPSCNQLFDADGFYEHGVPTLYWCVCGTIVDQKGTIIPKEKVDLSGLNESGLFIKAARLKETDNQNDQSSKNGT